MADVSLSLDAAPPDLSAQLQELGYCVIEGAAGAEWLARLRKEAQAVDARGSLEPSLNKLATAGSGGKSTQGALCAKRGVREAAVMLEGALTPPDAFADGAPFAASPTLAELATSCAPELVRSLNAAAPWLALNRVDTIKVQVNDGAGGCFPMHFDTTPQTSRRLTAILYLGEEWTPPHGGELRIYPCARRPPPTAHRLPLRRPHRPCRMSTLPTGPVRPRRFPLAPVDVAPRAGTLVLFSSVSSLHRVMPAYARRVAISIWLSGQSAEPRFPSAYPAWVGKDEASSLAFLRTSSNVAALTKVLYSQEWAASTEDAFGAGPDVRRARDPSRRDPRERRVRPARRMRTRAHGASALTSHSLWCAQVKAALELHHQEAARLEAQMPAPLLALLRSTLPLHPPPPEEEAEEGDLGALF